MPGMDTLTAAPPRHFLDLDGIDADTLRRILNRGAAYKRGDPGEAARPLAGKTLAMIFEKPSTRTRVSFEVGMRQLGGDVVVLSATEMQLGRGETVADTARVLSRYVDAIMIRTNRPEKLKELAAAATVPVINGLTDGSHPCQIMADVMTFEEKKGRSAAGSSPGAATATTSPPPGFTGRCASASSCASPARRNCSRRTSSSNGRAARAAG